MTPPPESAAAQSRSSDKSVAVTFVAPDSWTFSPEDVTMDGPGNVFMDRGPSGASWTFVGVNIADPHGQFSSTVTNQGARLVVRDDWRVKGNYKYVVTVRDENGTTYTSPDPQIINSGP